MAACGEALAGPSGCRSRLDGWYKEGKTMRQTTQREAARLLAVDIDGLAAMLSCGQATARKIGEDAGARILIGRRVLYSVDRVQRYLDAIAQ